MKKLLTAILILGTLLSGGFASARQPVVVGLNDDIHFDYPGYRANDFHIQGIVYSAGGVEPQISDIVIFGDPGTGNWSSSGWTLTPVPGSPDQWEFTLDFVTDGWIGYCQWIHFGVEFNVEARNIIARLKGWWTLDRKPVAVGDPAQAAVTGFEVTTDPAGERPGTRLRISNSSSLPVRVSQLEWTLFEDAFPLTPEMEPVPLEDMSKNPGGVGRPGEYSEAYPHLVWAPVQNIPEPLEIPPDSFFDVFFDMQIPQGHFLMLRGRQVPGDLYESKTIVDEDWGWFWEQHQEPFADPTIPIVVAVNDDVHFDYPNLIANDFHVEGIVQSTGGTRPEVKDIIIYGDPGTGNWQRSGFTLEPVPGSDIWKFSIDFVTDGTIGFCQWIHFGILFEVVDKNVIADLRGWWTLDGNPVVPGPVKPAQAAITGFNMFKEGTGTRIRMTNDTDMPIALSRLQAKVFDTPVPLEDMDREGIGVPQPDPEWTNLLDDPGQGPTLQPDSFFDVYVDLEIPDNGTILVRGRQLMVADDGTINDTGDWGWFWEQHQEPGPQVPPPALDRIKWKQRPDMKTGVNILSQASFDGQILPTVADDWFCLGGSPVSDLHFWGSYPGWKEREPDLLPGEFPPGVEAFRIQIYSDIPASADQLFSRPGKLLYETWVKHFSETYVAAIPLPWGTPDEPVFEHKYRYDLDLPRIFWQKRGTIYWLDISAVPVNPEIPWGWENSADRWNDIAVEGAPAGAVPWTPLYHPFFPQARFPLDMSFELTACRGPVKWLQFPDMAHGRNILSCPDETLVADDFLCTNGRSVTEVHFWGSYLTREGKHWRQDTPMPPAGEVPPKMERFSLRFFLDVPEGRDPDMPWSHPAPRGQIYKTDLFPDQVTVRYWDSIPHTRTDATGVQETWWEHKYYYTADLTQTDIGPFAQEKDRIYWLSVSAVPDCTGTDPCWFWGWETASDHWNDAAVQGSSAFWQALSGESFLDFEDLTPGTAYPVGSNFITNGAAITVEPFQYSTGTWTNTGGAVVFDPLPGDRKAGGSGNEVQPANVTLKFDFGGPVSMLDLVFGEYGGNLNLTINGDFRNFENVADILGLVIGGVQVSGTNGSGLDTGSLHFQGTIHGFKLGGQELWIDDIRAGKTDMAFLLMTEEDTDYCRADFDRDGDVDRADLKTVADDFGRIDCRFAGACEGDGDYDGDVDGSDLGVIAAELGRNDCPCRLAPALAK